MTLKQDPRIVLAKTCIAGLPAADLLPEVFGRSTLFWQLLRQFHRPSVKMHDAVGKKLAKPLNQSVFEEQNKLLLWKFQYLFPHLGRLAEE